jgi:hypothetical protein
LTFTGLHQSDPSVPIGGPSRRIGTMRSRCSRPRVLRLSVQPGARTPTKLSAPLAAAAGRHPRCFWHRREQGRPDRIEVQPCLTRDPPLALPHCSRRSTSRTSCIVNLPKAQCDPPGRRCVAASKVRSALGARPDHPTGTLAPAGVGRFQADEVDQLQAGPDRALVELCPSLVRFGPHGKGNGIRPGGAVRTRRKARGNSSDSGGSPTPS